MPKPFSRYVGLFVLLGLIVAPSMAAEESKPVVDIWPAGKIPGPPNTKNEEKAVTKGAITRIQDVSKPTLTIYHAPKGNDAGAAVIICPGGGYSILAWDLEGTEIAQWLNQAGVTGIILKYRVPAQRKSDLKDFVPLMDAQRAVSYVRTNAKEWGIDPHRIGILGFSAGGNLSALACTNFDHRNYDALDAVDEASCRPDFGVLVYPAYLLTDKTDDLSPLVPVSAKTPPIFFVHADNDKISSAGSAIMYLALKRAGVQSELHIYTSGGHGFGLRPTTRPVCEWPQRCQEWMKNIGLLKAADGKH